MKKKNEEKLLKKNLLFVIKKRIQILIECTMHTVCINKQQCESHSPYSAADYGLL